MALLPCLPYLTELSLWLDSPREETISALLGLPLPPLLERLRIEFDRLECKPAAEAVLHISNPDSPLYSSCTGLLDLSLLLEGDCSMYLFLPSTISQLRSLEELSIHVHGPGAEIDVPSDLELPPACRVSLYAGAQKNAIAELAKMLDYL